ncbi:HAMP domain-containing protein [Pseudothauera nasutitermitis]|uniref:histidine kinase n=1 Tax=Pseudothauera nasutitermitis TaxID=2565930 RepID=A0A4S4B2E8_9RHOO|nr:HAMP domain-containing protein [Pseudothauera nasutitermitis]
MSGQLIGLLLLGIVTAHLIVISLDGGSAGNILPDARNNAIESIATAYRAIEACGDCDVEALLAAMGSSNSSYRLVPDAPAVPEIDESEAKLAADLAASAGLPPTAEIHVNVEAPATDTYLPGRRRYATLDAALRLSDDRWLQASLRPVVRSQWWLRFSVPVSVLPVLLVVSLFARRILRPTKALAAAAERVSRGERVEPLPVIGPSELREATAAFNTMQQRLSRFIADRTTMLAAIGHDFRTPLASLRLQVELLDDEAVREPMRRKLDEMRDMIDATLHFARNDSVREPTEVIDLAAMVEGICKERSSLGQAVSWNLPTALPYRCRPIALARALCNLIGNAVHYGHSARVRLTPGDRTQGLSIVIDDDGPGIPEELLERVFEPFFRVESARCQEACSTGLGLAIARSCITAHGGEIRLENRDGGGLRATILLPA